MERKGKFAYSNEAVKRKCILIIKSLLSVFVICSCFYGVYYSRPQIIVDYNGKRIYADTPRAFTDWIKEVNIDIDREIFDRDNNIDRDWNAEWLNKIEYIKTNQQDPEKYINYIIERRRKRNLPELRGL
jgi:hypothetical protein